ncbi:uncharacterized protein LOC111717628, partial [Eurytemora carolleeae]|uniref:uncharacterized protein LOC111717628 n=1 Tax=Eurytemora carolleeae TaxID=1294199 RepID=UPI000C791CA1
SFELSRTRCVSIVEEDEGYVKLVAKTVAGCDQMYKCVRLFRRTENIIEIQEGSPTIHESYACDIVNFDEKRTIYTTLFREELNHVICPINGLHNVTGIYILGNTEQCEGQGFSHLNIRCGDQEHFIQSSSSLTLPIPYFYGSFCSVVSLVEEEV